MHCISCALKRKVEKPLLFKQTLKSRFTCLACQHFSFDAKKSLDRERPFSLALRVVSLFSFLSRLAPSITRVGICVSRVLLDRLQKKERLLVVYTGLSWYTNMAAVSLFWNTNMADVTSCAHTCYLTYITDFGYLVGSAELRKCEHAKKKKNGRKLGKVKATEGRRNRNDYYRLSLPLLFSPCHFRVHFTFASSLLSESLE